MWTEIKDKAKFSLFKIHNYLAIDKSLHLANSTRLMDFGKVSEDFYYDYATPESLLKRWKCVTDLYVENGFI